MSKNNLFIPGRHIPCWSTTPEIYCEPGGFSIANLPFDKSNLSISGNKSKLVSRYIVSTDDEKIRKASIKYGAEVPFLRPKKLSTNNAKAVSADIHAVKWAERDEGKKYDFFIELMATNPLKTHKDIDKVLRKLIKLK